MTAVRAPSRSIDVVANDEASWDEAVLDHGGHLLQSWRWGEFKALFGWQVERLAVAGSGGTALAQVLFRKKAGVAVGYIPRGPVLPVQDPGIMPELWALIDRSARRQRALTLVVEADRDLPQAFSDRVPLVPGPPPIQPSRSVKCVLLDDQGLMAQMHSKTRYNVRMAQRRGVVCRVAESGDDPVDLFYMMLQDTASRNDFIIHEPRYYREFLRVFADDAILMFAEIEGRAVAGAIAVTFGAEAIYMYGASSTVERANGAGFLIQYELMRWARDLGAQRYDLWGIPDVDPQSTVGGSGDRLASSRGSDWRGIYEFKTRFGGDIVRYPPPVERRYRPILASMARRLYGMGSSG